MRKRVTGIVAAAAIALTALGGGFTSEAKSGTWKQDSTGWWFENSDGSYAYSEWVDGYWLDASGYNTYAPKADWYSNQTGWWYQDSSGWYEQNNWEYIDGVCYHFDNLGYMCANEYVQGYWLNADGSWTYEPVASWQKDDTGWYYIDTAGYYPKNTTVKIDEVNYTFDEYGYLVNFTILTPKTGKTATLNFTVTPGNKSTAAKSLSNLLGTITTDGSTHAVKVDGVSKTVTNKGGTLYIDDETLDSYVTNKVNTTSTDVDIEVDTKATNIFSGISLAGSASYTYDIKVEGVTFKDIRVSGGWVTFKANGKSYKADVYAGSLYVVGDASGADWVSSFKTAGIIESSTPVVDCR